jgi:hypothetical protein
MALMLSMPAPLVAMALHHLAFHFAIQFLAAHVLALMLRVRPLLLALLTLSVLSRIML